MPFAAALAVAASWQHWINPLVDSGREMNVPARLLAGERLYRDVAYYYGPAGPWLQALVLAAWRAAGGNPHSWLPLQIACVLLAVAILALLHRLARTAAGTTAATAGTALAAVFCLAAPRGGSFLFPYSAASLYALAGALAAFVVSSGAPTRWRRIATILALTLAVTTRIEIGLAAAALLLAAAVRTLWSRRDEAPATAIAPILDVVVALALAGGAYAATLVDLSWRDAIAGGPLSHILAMPPEWRDFYAQVAGFAHPLVSIAHLVVGLVALAALAVPSLRLRPASERPAPASPRANVIVALALAIAACVYCTFGRGFGLPWSRLVDPLPPLFFPLPLLAAVATFLTLLRGVDAEDARARFLLFGMATAAATRVPLGLRVGPQMDAFCALPLAPLLVASAVLVETLAPRTRAPSATRARFAAAATVLAALFLVRIAATSWSHELAPLSTPGGALRLPRQQSNALRGLLAYLRANARADDRMAVLPEGSFLNFVSGLRTPMREEQLFPGALYGGREDDAVRRLLAAQPRFVVLVNRPTDEWGARAFGRDYAESFWAAIERRYVLAAKFGPAAARAPVGSHRFFVRVYVPRPPEPNVDTAGTKLAAAQ